MHKRLTPVDLNSHQVKRTVILRKCCHTPILLQMMANFGELQPPDLGIISIHIE